MNTELTPDDVLQELPDWQDATWTELDGGLSNRTFRLQKGGRSAVLKIDDGPRQAPLNTRSEEAVIQAAAARVGLGNPVLQVGEGIYLSEYIEGEVWGSHSFNDDANLERLALAMRRLHSLPLTGRTFDAMLAAKRYASNIDRDRVMLDRCMSTVEKMRRPQNLCCCHNDLVAENILSTPAVRFLDWEYACDNDPLFDLATIVEHHQLDERQEHTLLAVYFDGNGERWRERLADQKRLYAALLWLWMASRPATSARRPCPGLEVTRIDQV